MTSENHCPICKSSALKKEFVGIKDLEYYSYGPVDFSRCLECEVLFQDPMPPEELIPTFYPSNYRNYLVEEKPSLLAGLKNLQASMFARNIIKHLKNPTEQKILDLGFGNGQLLLALDKIGCKQLTGADFSESPQHERLRKAGVRLAFSNFDKQFPFDEIEKFDCIILNNVIEHFLDPVRILSFCKARLADEGKIILITPSSDSLDFDIFKSAWAGFHAPRHTYIFNHRSMEELARRSGLKLSHIEAFSDPGQWAISCQSLMVAGNLTKKAQLKNGLAPYTVPLSLLFGPISIIQGCTKKSSAILSICT